MNRSEQQAGNSCLKRAVQKSHIYISLWIHCHLLRRYLGPPGAYFNSLQSPCQKVCVSTGCVQQQVSHIQDIPGPSLFSAQAGRHFTIDLLFWRPKTPRPFGIPKRRPKPPHPPSTCIAGSSQVVLPPSW